MEKVVLSEGVVWINTNNGGLPVMEKGGKCPYCGDKHVHGKGSGHRLAHCGAKKPFPIRSPFGPWRDKLDGYYYVDCKLNDMAALFKELTEMVSKELDDKLDNLIGGLSIVRE